MDFDNCDMMAEPYDSDDGYYPDILPLELDEDSDVSSPFSKPLTISEVENYLYVDSAQQTEGPRVGDEQSQIVESEPSVAKKDLESHSGVPNPETPRWNFERPYLTGRHIFLDNDICTSSCSKKHVPGKKMENAHQLDAYCPSVQELIIVEELLAAMMGIDGNYVRVRKGRDHHFSFVFYVDSKLNNSLHELVNRILPICENYMVVSQFVEARSHFKHGLTNHAFASGLRAILQDYHAMVAQLEHQFRLGRLSLPGLWFFVQPMIGAMQCLSTVLQIASMQGASGATLLNLLHNQATAMAGDSAVRALLQKLTHAASSPYFRILERWVYEGVIDDPYGEFLIDENKTLEKESLSQDYHATYWQKRYSLRQEIPEFLASSAEIILTTGKYLNAIRECGQCIQGPSVDEVRVANPMSKRPYLERINVAHSYASAELLDLIVNKFDLVGRLRSVKHYFFIEKGDFLVIFMDTAKDELAKRPAALSKERLQSLLELALRTSVAASDPYHDDLTCIIEKPSLQMQLQKIMQNENGPATQSTQTETSSAFGGATGSITGVDTFVLDYKVRWPVSLVLSRRALTKYQLIFRHLFHCKHVRRQLCAAWQIHQLATRPFDITGTAISRSYAVCQRMLHFVQSFEHYMTFEVLEPNWHSFHNSLCCSNSVDEVMQQHEAFLDKCLKQCMFFWPKIFKKVDNLKGICLQYATATQWLIPTLFTKDDGYNVESPRLVVSLQSAFGGDVSSTRQRSSGRFRKQDKLDPRRARQAADDRNFKNTVGRIDADFNKELGLLVDLLIIGSQQEPYLVHLVQALEAVKRAASHPSSSLLLPLFQQ